MRFLDIIAKKREGLSLSTEEIDFWIHSYTEGLIPDYQVSSLLMAIVLNGMDARETSDLTFAMMHSGDVIDLSGIEGIKADKHSTGGVGDKTSLALGPMVAACGVKLAKMSGRGLGHTGGTLDKLESIDGFNCYLSEDEFRNQVNAIGIAIIGQSANLVPADKKLYALRDVTATVDSMPLIASSIMSKKLAAGSDVIVLDVKYGSGAFMKTPEDAIALGKMMMEIGQSLGRSVSVMVTDMDEPLGWAIGNALEVKEAVETLKGNGPEDFTQLCLMAGSMILVKSGVAESLKDAEEKLRTVIANGKALEKLKAMVKAQGGAVRQIEQTDLLPKAKFETVLTAREDGYITRMEAQKLGTLAMKIGAGRETKEDSIKAGTGIVLCAKVGHKLEIGQSLATIYHDEPLSGDWIEAFYSCYQISKIYKERNPLVYAVLE